MSSLVYHIVSGQAFFTGILLVVTGTLATRRPKGLLRRLSTIMILLGWIAVAVSSTAIPYWIYALCGTATVMWLATGWLPQWRNVSLIAVLLCWFLSLAVEIPHHVSPQLEPVPGGLKTLAVIGDSVTAGMGGEDIAETWPKILAREHRIAVQDRSHVGETAGSALKRLQQTPLDSADLVLLEIGGNDLLGSTSVAQFQSDLDALLSQVAGPSRQVVMFELPLPPFYHEYGRAQRDVARKYQVLLIPKRVFLGILAGEESTLDSIHLSAAGHRRMADTIWEIVRPASRQ
ncbi:MAG: GDSL-type esterase/lipase family protein [Planctomycetota bacterium]|nr:GDSL-type esterase/lipase family protein [Planctomycetota bacterium]